MFRSFFPNPRLFFPSVLVWSAFCIAVWYVFGETVGTALGAPPWPEDTLRPVDVRYFVTPDYLWFYAYFILAILPFAGFWFTFSPHPWQRWSILGSALILFVIYFGVQVSLAVNDWLGRFFDLVQLALEKKFDGTAWDFYFLLLQYASIAAVAIVVFTLTRFFVSHWVFRWRNAMNDYYLARWPEVRGIEGAAQRVQEDTMRFADIMQDLGTAFVDSVMTLIAFLPILAALSGKVTVLPLIGEIPAPLVTTAIFWSVFGTVLLAVAGIRLPGLQFANQRVEAAFRKELVYGEDDAARARPDTVRELFVRVRRNYFRLYFHYAYFNVVRSFYLRADSVFAYVILVPTIVAGTITFGVMQQIVNVFGQVSGSFQYLVNSWTTIIELLSIHKRLRAFEAAFEGRAHREMPPEADLDEGAAAP
ncbi:MAG: peptide antibiotic transporter SbmA [Paracoccaceae bacterium]